MSTTMSPDYRLLAEGVRSFVLTELRPHEEMVDRLGEVPDELFRELQQRAIKAGFYALNMPAEHGGGGLCQEPLVAARRSFFLAGAAIPSLYLQV